MKAFTTPFDIIRSWVPPFAETKRGLERRLIVLRRRLRKLNAARSAAVRLVASFDKTIELETRRLRVTEQRKEALGGAPSRWAQAWLSVPSVHGRQSETSAEEQTIKKKRTPRCGRRQTDQEIGELVT